MTTGSSAARKPIPMPMRKENDQKRMSDLRVVTRFDSADGKGGSTTTRGGLAPRGRWSGRVNILRSRTSRLNYGFGLGDEK